MFQPIGKYATDVHYLHMQVPVHFNQILQSIKNMSDYMIDIVDESKSKATSLIIQEITIFNHLHVDLIKTI